VRGFTAIAVLALTMPLPIVTVTATATSSVLTCDGKPATHVGTNGKNKIVGTAGADVIVGKGGDDTIKGRGGKDRICGGGGSDDISGGGGIDRIFGNSGHDFLEGGDGDDRIFGGDGNDLLFGDDGHDRLDGGPDFDDCTNGPGIGERLRCEFAYFAVDVSSPAQTSEELITFTIEVTNTGPDEVPYRLFLEVDSPDLDCGSYPWEGSSSRPILSVGEVDHLERQVSCDNPRGDDPRVEMLVLAFPLADDPHRGDNSDSSTTHAIVE
jgi:Ca2+-binding RTX toxin-like protein